LGELRDEAYEAVVDIDPLMSIFSALKVSALELWENDATTGNKLGICEGRCMYDDHCATGLVCLQNATGSVPGCHGKTDGLHGYCILPEANKKLSHWEATTESLGLCEGDCYLDSHCEGNLECVRREGNPYTPCRGLSQKFEWVFLCLPSGIFSTFSPTLQPTSQPTSVHLPSMLPSGAPTFSIETVCASLERGACRGSEDCIFSHIKRVNKCFPKTEYEFDCSIFTSEMGCNSKQNSQGHCVYTEQGCTHKCSGSSFCIREKNIFTKEKMCEVVEENNPCFGCKPKTTCGLNRRLLSKEIVSDESQYPSLQHAQYPSSQQAQYPSSQQAQYPSFQQHHSIDLSTNLQEQEYHVSFSVLNTTQYILKIKSDPACTNTLRNVRGTTVIVYNWGAKKNTGNGGEGGY